MNFQWFLLNGNLSFPKTHLFCKCPVTSPNTIILTHVSNVLLLSPVSTQPQTLNDRQLEMPVRKASWFWIMCIYQGLAHVQPPLVGKFTSCDKFDLHPINSICWLALLLSNWFSFWKVKLLKERTRGSFRTECLISCFLIKLGTCKVLWSRVLI